MNREEISRLFGFLILFAQLIELCDGKRRSKTKKPRAEKATLPRDQCRVIQKSLIVGSGGKKKKKTKSESRGYSGEDYHDNYEAGSDYEGDHDYMYPSLTTGGYDLGRLSQSPSDEMDYKDSLTEFNSRFWGGKEIAAKDAPFMATLFVRVPEAPEGLRACSGSFITPRVVITAAHCLAFRRVKNLFVVYDTTDTTGPSKGGKHLQVVKFLIHPRFLCNSVAAAWDIALVFLEKDKEGNHVDSVLTLPLQDDDYDDLFMSDEQQVALDLYSTGLTFDDENPNFLKKRPAYLIRRGCEQLNGGAWEGIDFDHQLCTRRGSLITCAGELNCEFSSHTNFSTHPFHSFPR